MKTILSPIEWSILTCIEENQEIDLISLSIHLNIASDIIFRCLQNLLIKNFVFYKDCKYLLNQDKKEELSQIYRTEHNIIQEFQAIIQSVVKNKKNETLKLKKIYATDSDIVILNSMLSQIDLFVKNLSKERRKNKSQVKTSPITLFWGHEKQEQILNSLIRAN